MKSPRILLLIAAMSCMAASSCNNNEAGFKGANTPIADYLYGIEYDDYDLQANLDYFNRDFIPGYPSCSEVRKGRFVGRNLDWYINNDAAAIIKINHTDDHYASIGMVGCFPPFSNGFAKSQEYDEIYKYLPFKTADGINEKGLYVGVNVMPTGETSFDMDSWEPYAFGYGAADTNPDSDMHYCVIYLVRIVLDRAGSVEEAMELIDSINWTEPKNFPYEGATQSFHWLICDAKQSVVLEFMDNKAVYTKAPSINEPSLGNIMTNFTNCLMDKGIFQISGNGLERWDILHDSFASTPESFEGMQELMSKVWYTRFYKADPTSRDFWFTECSNSDFPTSSLYKNYDIIDSPEFQELAKRSIAPFYDKSLWHVDDTPLWYTTHTSIYDLQSKTMRVLVHEGLEGQAGFYEASLDRSKFAKPLKNRD